MKTFQVTLTLVALAGLCLVLTSKGAVVAEPSARTNGQDGQPLTGTVEAINGSKVTIRTEQGIPQTFQVDPEVLSSLNLEPGLLVIIGGDRFQMGQIKGINRYTIKVELDSGETTHYFLTPENRQTLTIGDRVVIPTSLSSTCCR